MNIYPYIFSICYIISIFNHFLFLFSNSQKKSYYSVVLILINNYSDLLEEV